MGTLNRSETSASVFVDRVGVELKRAERYRIFISLIIFDVSFIESFFPDKSSSVKTELAETVGKHIRAIDDISYLGSGKLGLLLPETTRQGAEIASRRITEVVKTKLSEMNNSKRFDQIISLEMASYPDAAGAKSIDDFLREYTDLNMN